MDAVRRAAVQWARCGSTQASAASLRAESWLLLRPPRGTQCGAFDMARKSPEPWPRPPPLGPTEQRAWPAGGRGGPRAAGAREALGRRGPPPAPGLCTAPPLVATPALRSWSGCTSLKECKHRFLFFVATSEWTSSPRRQGAAGVTGRASGGQAGHLGCFLFGGCFTFLESGDSVPKQQKIMRHRQG